MSRASANVTPPVVSQLLLPGTLSIATVHGYQIVVSTRTLLHLLKAAITTENTQSRDVAELLSGKTVIGCEKSDRRPKVPDVQLTCGKYRVIDIRSANYGRTKPDPVVCPYNAKHNNAVNCVSTKALDKVKASCNGKRECSVAATNANFGDTCSGTYKYLEINYICRYVCGTGKNGIHHCRERKNGDYQSCNGCNVYATCSNHILSDNRPCPAGLVWDDNKKRCDWTSTTCVTDTPIVEPQKSSKRAVAPAQDDKTVKSIAVFRRSVGCERNTKRKDEKDVKLNCPLGDTIKVLKANYGRTKSSVGPAGVCPYGAKHDNKVDCIDSKSLSKVQQLCDGKSSCLVPPTNAVFGDPCVGTYKYLQVDYTCRRGCLTGPRGITSCENRPNGDYQSCSSCHVYATCSNGLLYDNRPCPANLVWDDNKKRCEYKSKTCLPSVAEGECIRDCTDLENGDYQSCKGCHVYATCSNGLLYDLRPCPDNLFWDDEKKRCEHFSSTCASHSGKLN